MFLEVLKHQKNKVLKDPLKLVFLSVGFGRRHKYCDRILPKQEEIARTTEFAMVHRSDCPDDKTLASQCLPLSENSPKNIKFDPHCSSFANLQIHTNTRHMTLTPPNEIM